MRWFLTSQLIRQRSNVSEWLQSHQRAVLLACTVIAVGAFARFEVQILASGTPTWWAWSDQGKYLEFRSSFRCRRPYRSKALLSGRLCIIGCAVCQPVSRRSFCHRQRPVLGRLPMGIHQALRDTWYFARDRRCNLSGYERVYAVNSSSLRYPVDHHADRISDSGRFCAWPLAADLHPNGPTGTDTGPDRLDEAGRYDSTGADGGLLRDRVFPRSTRGWDCQRASRTSTSRDRRSCACRRFGSRSNRALARLRMASLNLRTKNDRGDGLYHQFPADQALQPVYRS